MKPCSGRGRRGNATIEFTLVGIPIIFVLISTFELARGMWIYHTLAYAVKEGSRFAIVKGVNCATLPNACSVTVGRVAQEIKNAGVGLLPGTFNVTLRSDAGTVACNPLSTCLARTDRWPPDGANNTGSDIQVIGSYPFASALAILWPGSAPVIFAPITFPSSSQERIQF